MCADAHMSVGCPSVCRRLSLSQSLTVERRASAVDATRTAVFHREESTHRERVTRARINAVVRQLFVRYRGLQL